MSQGDEILDYIFLEYVSGANFLARLTAAKSQSDIESLLRYSVKDAIASYGYRADLWYDNVMRAHLGSLAGWSRYSYPRSIDKNAAYVRIFDFDYDPYFGERLSFDPVRFREFIDVVVARSTSHVRVNQQIDRFGNAGLKNAIDRLAAEHKWTRISVEETIGVENPLSTESDHAIGAGPLSATYLLSATEGERIVSRIRELKETVEQSDLSQADRTQALMLVDAALILSQMPSPSWKLVKETLYILAAVSTVFALAIEIAEMIK